MTSALPPIGQRDGSRQVIEGIPTSSEEVLEDLQCLVEAFLPTLAE